MRAAKDPAKPSQAKPEQSRAANALWFLSLMYAEGAVALVLVLALALSMYCIACGRKRRGEERRGYMDG
jgi:hypothetical protein